MGNKHGRWPQCPLCGKRFPHQDHVQKHIEQRHDPERSPEEEFRARMQAYHQDKIAAEKRGRK